MKTVTQRSPHSQSGMVSIMVTLILMLVISMIVIGFAQISRREQRQSLDRQLSTQAFFAAESGVNDAQKVIRDSLSAGLPIPEKDECSPGAASPTNPYGAFDPDIWDGVGYTCLLVSTQLTNIKQVVGTGNEAVTIPLHPVPSGGQINRLHIRWTAPNVTSTAGCADNSVPASGYFPRASDWSPCPYGVLRVDMVPTDPALLNRTAMRNNQRAFYLYPTARNSITPVPTLDYATARGAVAPMACTVSEGCSVDITNISGSTNYALRLSSIYTPGTVDISADGTLGPTIALKDAQAQVDVTGRAEDVLRRIQVRLPISQGSASSGYALQSGSSICKRFGVGPGQFQNSSDIIGIGQDPNNPLCVPFSIVPPSSATKPPVFTPVPSQCAVKQDIVLTFDLSNSMLNTFGKSSILRKDKLKDVGRYFVANSEIGGAGDFNHGAIVGFNDGAVLYQPLTNNQGSLISKINSMQNDGGTYYLDALTKSKDAWSRSEARPDAKKILIFFSDGEPDDDVGAILDMADQLKASGVIIYTVAITLNTDEYKVLINMADSPGNFASANEPEELDAIIDELVKTIVCKKL